jgi:hypothetical protein
MASIINASTTPTSGLVQTADASGVLQLQSNGTTGLTVGSGGVVTAANGIVMNTMTLGTPITGEFEYDGRVPYFTPAGTQRGVVPGMQYYVMGSSTTGANTTSAQSILGVGVTLSSNTIYEFEAQFNFFKTTGTTSHNVAFQWGGTVTTHRIMTNLLVVSSNVGFITVDTSRFPYQYVMETAGPTVVTANGSSAFRTVNMIIRGIINVNQGGTLIPQYALSNAPGGAYISAASNYMSIWPIGVGGNNAGVNVGTWA